MVSGVWGRMQGEKVSDKSIGRRYAAAALGNLAINNNNRTKIAELGGLEALVTLERSSCSKKSELAAFALGNLAFNNNANWARISELGGMQVLL